MIFQIINFIYKLKRNRFTNYLSRMYNLKFDFEFTNGDHSIFKDIFYTKSYAMYFPFYQDAVIIDVGAHKGFFSLFASINVSKNSKIYSIEPSSSNFKLLLDNMKINGTTNVIPQNFGVDGQNGEVKLFLSLDENNSLLANPQNNNVDKYELVQTVS